MSQGDDNLTAADPGLNPDAEAPFGTATKRGHAAFHPFRSVENGLASVRADTHALSLITDRFGRVVALAEKPGPAIVTAAVDAWATRPTLYRRIGDRFALLCAAAAVLFLAVSLPQHRSLGRDQP